MPDGTLPRRFLANWPAPFTPEAELVYESPRRQKELLAIGRQQLDAQRSAATTIARSNVAAAEIIANEINQQTASLEAGLREYSTRVSSSMSDAADHVAAAVEVLGDRLCAYLGEITWQLAQQGETLAGILGTLRESRSNEARQLVEQGVRHYINEQYDRAEERFRQALAQDTTDYQVLMNLGQIAIQKGVSADALQFFHDALRLPFGPDPQAKSRALMAIARVHYVQQEYAEAAANARRAVALVNRGQVDDVFMLGTYASLAGDVDACVGCLEQVIRSDAVFFSRSAIEPDLEPSRSQVLSLLSRLALEARGRVENEVTEARDLLGAIRAHVESAAVMAEARLAAQALDDISSASSRASYSDLLAIHLMASTVTRALRLLANAEDAGSRARAVRATMLNLERADSEAAKSLEILGDHVPGFRIRLWALWHLLTFIFIIGPAMVDQRTNRVPIIMDIYFVGGFFLWAWLQHLTHKSAERSEKAYQLERSTRLQKQSAEATALASARQEVQRFETESEKQRKLARVQARLRLGV